MERLRSRSRQVSERAGSSQGEGGVTIRRTTALHAVTTIRIDMDEYNST
jgi:hypothetical protein